MRSLEVIVVLVVAFGYSWTGFARADDANELQACLQAHTDGQRARNAGKLVSAANEFARCADAACPSGPRSDCTEWLGEVQQGTPSVAVSVRGEKGEDHVDATLYIDGQLVRPRLYGRSIAVDPGAHVLRVEFSDGRSTEERFVAREGEKNRPIAVAFPSAALGIKEPVPVSTRRPVPVGTYLLIGVSVAGAATFAAFGADGKTRQSSLEADPCRGTRTCSESRVDVMYRSYTVADIALLVSFLSGTAAVVSYALRPSVQREQASPSASWFAPNAPGVRF